MHHRELLGPLCTAAWQTVCELMAVAAGEEKGFRPGIDPERGIIGMSRGL